MQKKNLPKNEVQTSTEMNLAAAKCCVDFRTACMLFRRLEHANNRGTGETQFDELADRFDRVQNYK